MGTQHETSADVAEQMGPVKWDPHMGPAYGTRRWDPVYGTQWMGPSKHAAILAGRCSRVTKQLWG